MPIPIIIDSDMALDDWMAILYLLRSPDADVMAITVSGTGEAHAWPGMQTALRLLALADHPSIPVCAGSPRPLKGNHVFPYAVRLAVDLHLAVRMPPARASGTHLDAASQIIQILDETEEPVTIVALGPLTNIAQVFLLRPDLTGKLAGITIMGGALDVPGNIMSINPRIQNLHAEWNIFIDPCAANVVFSSGVPITLVPLDATNQVPLSREFLSEMSGQASIPAVDFLCRALQRVLGRSKGDHTFYFWDPLAAVLAVRPEIGVYQACRLRVVEKEGCETGRVIRDENGGSIRVCTGTDRVIFERLYLEGVEGRLSD